MLLFRLNIVKVVWGSTKFMINEIVILKPTLWFLLQQFSANYTEMRRFSLGKAGYMPLTKDNFTPYKKLNISSRQTMKHYYPTAFCWVQIMPKMSTNITRYLHSRWPVRQVCLVLLLFTNQLAGFPALIPFRFAYFCHAFHINKYPRNSPARTYPIAETWEDWERMWLLFVCLKNQDIQMKDQLNLRVLSKIRSI